MARHCYVLRVFTRGGAGGNHLGLVTDILGLDDHKMQRIASGLGFSETIFLSWFEGDMPAARIFTPVREIPFAGHPLVGAAWVFLNLAPVDPGGIDYPAGRVLISREGETAWITTTSDLPVQVVGAAIPFDHEEAIEVQVPSPYLLVKVSSPEQVAAVSPSRLVGLGDVYVWSADPHRGTVKARFFAPDFGIEEDPATGSAAVALAARMRWAGAPGGRLAIHQGDEVGFPSLIHLRWDRSSTSIGGAVIRDETRFLEL
jgi:trans-2,3-dihydro-3-hydroxyanthranilate isomerase